MQMQSATRAMCVLAVAACAPTAAAAFVNFNDLSGDVVVRSRAGGFNPVLQQSASLPDNFTNTPTPLGGSTTATDATPWVTNDFTIPGLSTSETSWLFSTTATTATFEYAWSHSANLDGNGGSAGSSALTSQLQVVPNQPIYVAVFGFYETVFEGPTGGQTNWSVDIGNGFILDASDQVVGGAGTRFEIFEIFEDPYDFHLGRFGFDAQMVAFGDPNGVAPSAAGSNGIGFGELTFILSTEPIPAAPTAAPLALLMVVAARRRRIAG